MKKYRGPQSHKVTKSQAILFILLCSGVLMLNGCVKREIKNIDSKGRNIICFGDSITFGYAVGRDETYPARLAKMTDVPVVNAGIDGDTSIEALRRIKADILSRKPLLVIIEFGGNDFLRKIPKEATLNNIREMIDKIQAGGAIAAIVDISASIFLSEYHKDFYRLAKEKGAIFIPQILSGIITNSSFKSDFIHPNADGYKMIAERVYTAISPYLKQNAVLRNPKPQK